MAQGAAMGCRPERCCRRSRLFLDRGNLEPPMTDASHQSSGRLLLTIGIKALNEEQHIAMAIESALAAAAPLGGEVGLADSGSTDRTLEIARGYPVRIVQLGNLAERCCGAGAQLAFQSAQGEFFYL